MKKPRKVSIGKISDKFILSVVGKKGLELLRPRKK